MVKDNRKTFAIVVFVVFAVILIYLLLFNQGLGFEKEESGSGIAVFVKNNSDYRKINNVSVFVVSNGQEKLLSFSEELMPGERKKIDLENQKGIIKLKIVSPFHAVVETEITLRNDSSSFTYTLSIPNPMLVDRNYNTSLFLCNKGIESDISVEFVDKFNFFNPIENQNIFLEQDDCKNITFKLTPIKIGTTQIFFNIKSLDYSDSIGKEINILELDLNG